MENLPVEVIGNILSCLASARDVVVASTTCKKWREAWCYHLHTLSFHTCDWHVYSQLSTARLEMIITETIFQIKGLQSLDIFMIEEHVFSAAPLMAWLMHTRDSLRQLRCDVKTIPNFNIIEKCNRQRLEVLSLAHNSITGFVSRHLKFPCLKLLSLSYVSISAVDLSLLLSACPKLETLALVCPEIAMSDSRAGMVLSSSSLKDFSIQLFGANKFVLKADSLERLQLKDCNFEVFELIGKGTLKVFKMEDVSAVHLDIGDGTENLEVVDVCNFITVWTKFYQMISKASKLVKLRLWGVVFDDEDEVVDIETISVWFPRLRHLSLSYDLKGGVLHYGLPGMSCLMNVVVLELGWTTISDLFSVWVAGLLEGCPNLKKMVIHGFLSEVKTHEECLIFAKYADFVLQLGRKYEHVNIDFEYE